MSNKTWYKLSFELLKNSKSSIFSKPCIALQKHEKLTLSFKDNSVYISFISLSENFFLIFRLKSFKNFTSANNVKENIK